MRRLLLIDDDEILGRLLGRLLGREGFEVRVASDGADAMRALAAGPWDGIVLDLRIPGCDPEELIGAIPSGPPRPAVIAVSGLPPPPHLASILAARGIPFLQKPFRPDALLRHLGTAPGGPPAVVG